MKDFGYAVTQSLVDKGFLQNGIADIYYLKKEDIASLKKSGDKFSANLINAINKSKNNNLDKLISSLGIRHVGTKAAKILAKEYGSMDKLMKADTTNLSAVQEIGDITAKSIYDFFHMEQTIELIEKLKTAGVNMKNETGEELDRKIYSVCHLYLQVH